MKLHVRLALSLLIGLTTTQVVRADGKAFSGRDRTSFMTADAGEQWAFLSCDGTRQRMIVAIGLDWRRDETEGLWLLPVRGRAEDVKIDRLRDVPRLAGRDPRVVVGNAVQGIGAAIVVMQVWPAPAMCVLLPSLSRSRGAGTFAAIEQDGLRTELIAAENVDALRDHLTASGATLPADGLDSFAPYFDGRHSFVATWITDASKLAGAGRQPAVFVDFPSRELWYPMRATSGYRNAAIEFTLCVDGLVRSAEAERLGGDFRPFRSTASSSSNGIQHWTGRTDATIDYTVIDFMANGTELTADLFFTPIPPPRGWALASALLPFVGPQPWKGFAVGLPLVAACLFLAGGIAGRASRSGFRFGGLVGLTGLLTLVTTYYVTRDMRGPAFDRFRERRRAYLVSYTACAFTIGVAIYWAGAGLIGMR